MRTTTAVSEELERVIAEGEAAGARGDTAAIDRAIVRASELQLEMKSAREYAITQIGGLQTMTTGPDLATALLDAGFDRKHHPAVTVDSSYALGFELKAGSVSGGVDGTEVVDRFVAAPLGLDARYIYTHLPIRGVPADDTGVQSYRQASRSLASPASMVRTIADTSAKPETNTAAEVVNEPLKQVATVSSGTPNILLASDSFRGWVNTDLTHAYRSALDAHIISEVASANIPTGGGGPGFNAFENVRYAQESVRSAGYNPDLVVVSPGDALGLELLLLEDGQKYVFSQSPPAVVVSPSVGDGEGFVCDSSALGTLFLSPFSLQSFEENAGTTNTSTVRAESNGLFLVQRPDAAATIAGTS